MLLATRVALSPGHNAAEEGNQILVLELRPNARIVVESARLGFRTPLP